MSLIYLIRHGQAGTRLRYDTLSEVGRRQARLLGESLVAHQVEFTAAVSGGLERQRLTGCEVAAVYRAVGRDFPALATDPLWNEFDLDAVHRDIAPVLAARDQRFRAEYEEMQTQLHDESHAIHHHWSRCDVQVLEAWVSGSVPCRTESWVEFQDRVGRAWRSLERFAGKQTVAVFTSATPMGIAMGLTLGIDGEARAHFASALYNSAYLTLRLHKGALSLMSFNNTPHLADPGLRTFR